jgi:chaperonin cofactor prefoldin
MENSMDDRLDRLEKAIFERFDKMNARQDKMDERLDRLQADVASMRTYLLDFRAEVNKRFDAWEIRVEVVTDAARSIDMRMPGLTRAINDLQIRLERLERPAA